MNPRETPLIGLIAAVFSMVSCQLFARAAGHHAQFTHAQISAGLTICLAGVVVGLLLVLGVSVLRDTPAGWQRSLGALGLALGCAVLFALVGRHLPHSSASAPIAREPASSRWVVAAHDAPSRAPSPSR